MGNAVEHESIGGLLESYAFIEAFGIFLCLNVYACGMEAFYRCVDGIKHNLLAIASASLCGDNPSDGNLMHVGSCRTYTS